MAAGRAIEWGRFIDIDLRAYAGTDAVKKRRLQFAYRLDPSLVGPLKLLPPSVASDPPPSLAERNLRRGWLLGLPSGQSVARAMNQKLLEDKEIIIGKAVDPADIDPADSSVPIVSINPVFAGNCPLWTYILAEAALHKQSIKIPVTTDVNVNTPQLGPVGGRIVAEVFLGMLFGDGSSMLSQHPDWKPMSGPDFKLKDIVSYALGRSGKLTY